MHIKKRYHLFALEAARLFIAQKENSSLAIENRLDLQRAQQASSNRQAVRSLFAAILFLARQNIPFRGHKEGAACDILNYSVENEGYFRALLRYTAEKDDTVLASHIESGPRNAQYTSPDMQNALIEACGKVIQSKIVKGVQDSALFTIMADDTADCACIEQLCILVRFLSGAEIRENLLALCDISGRQSGENIANAILSTFRANNLNLNNCVGIGFNGASALTGKHTGANTQGLHFKGVSSCCLCSLRFALSESCTCSLFTNCCNP